MKVVQEQYGGAAEAAGKSGLAGAFDSLMETLRDAGEVIGKALEPLAVGAMQAISQGVQFLGDVWNQRCNALKCYPSVQEALKPIFESLKKIYDAIDWEASWRQLLRALLLVRLRRWSLRWATAMAV